MTQNITKKSAVRVQWNDKWENYSKEKERDIIKHVKNKYGVSSVKVDFTATNKINLGVANMENGDVENINSPEVQEKIIVNWLKENRIDIALPDIKRLNKRVEDRLIDFNNTKDNKWVIKSLTVENFLSYGEKTHFDFDKLKGITLISGRNFAGKTTILNAIMYLLYNTTEKNKVADEVINRFNDAEFARVSGELIIDDVEYLLVREVRRKYKKDRSSYTTSTSLKFLTKNPEGVYEEMDKEEDRKATDTKIKEYIGNLNEFLMTIVCTGDNIFDIIKAKPTERGQLLSRFLGLEIYEKKEKVAKEIYSEWKVKADIHKYSSIDLQKDIDDGTIAIANLELEITEHKTELSPILFTKQVLQGELTELQGYYNNDIDASLSNFSEQDFINNIAALRRNVQNKQVELSQTKDKLKTDLEEFNDSAFEQNKQKIKLINDEQLATTTEIKKNERDIITIEYKVKDIEGDNKFITSELNTLRATIKQLKEGDKCPECNQKLADVDHTEVIATKIAYGVSKKAEFDANLLKIEEVKSSVTVHHDKIASLNEVLVKLAQEVKDINKENEELLKVKERISQNDIVKLTIDKIEVEIEIGESKVEKENARFDKFKQDITKIEKNKDLDSKIFNKKIDITRAEEQERLQNRRITELETNIKNLESLIEDKNVLIDKIKKEEHIAKIFDVYINMVGKNGIAKTIMRNAIPVLNIELKKFLSDSAEFTVEIEINIKNNEVEFWLVDNETGLKAPMLSGSGYERTIGSLAIRIVNSKVNTLPKPSLLLIDEIFSTVDNENLELVKMFIDKVASTIDNVIIITHNELVKEWADHIVTVTKNNHISKVNF